MQDLIERVRELMGFYDEPGESRVSRPLWLTLLSGLLGLLFGLFIGWVLWPVEWENIRPTHLDPDSKAQYIAAVADAYVANGETQEARDLAGNRLTGMDVRQDLGLAYKYYIGDLVDDEYGQSARFDRENRLQNLDRLAYALNIDPAVAITSVDMSGIATREPGTVDNGGISVDGDQSVDLLTDDGQGAVAAESSGFNLGQAVQLAFTCLFALALILGGLYLLNYWWNRRQQGDEFDDSDTSGGIGPYRDKPRVGGGQDDDEDDDFDDDDDGDFDDYIEGHDPHRSYEPEDSWQTAVDEVNPYQPDVQSATRPVSSYDSESSNGGFNAAPQARQNSGVASSGVVAAAGGAAAAGAAAFRREATVDSPAPQQVRQPFSQSDSSILPPEIDGGSRTPTMRTAPTAPPVDASTGTVLTQFTARYQRGTQQYEQQRTLIAPNNTGQNSPEGLNIGECGMGVNIKNGILQSDAENVIALDVWLFDKTDQQGPRNQTRVLISEYVVDHDLSDAITRDDVGNFAPIVPQKGDTFEIHGNSLRLLCKVIEAVYVKSGDMMGVFESITVDMTVIHN